MSIKYIGMDVHKESISIAVMNGDGKVVMESVITPMVRRSPAFDAEPLLCRWIPSDFLMLHGRGAGRVDCRKTK
jgi:hypothetical protein